jgi:ABC-type phosphate transport system permease subunit
MSTLELSPREGASTRAAVNAQLTGSKPDIKGIVFQALLLLALLMSLVILVAVIGQMFAKGAHVFADRGMDFITADR